MLAKRLNLVLFQGPDQPASNIADRMEGRNWDVTGVGWGIRNSTMLELVNLFEGIVLRIPKDNVVPRELTEAHRERQSVSRGRGTDSLGL